MVKGYLVYTVSHGASTAHDGDDNAADFDVGAVLLALTKQGPFSNGLAVRRQAEEARLSPTKNLLFFIDTDLLLT